MRNEPPTGDDLERRVASIQDDVERRIAASPRRASRSARTGLVVGLATVLGLGAIGGAVAFGVTLSQPPAPIVTETPTPTATPTPSATPTPTPTPTTPPPAAAPTVRVPTTCEELTQGIDISDQYGPLKLVAAEAAPYSNSYVDDRAGYLSCGMVSASADPSTGYLPMGALRVSVIVAPDVSDAAFEERIRMAANWPDADPITGFGPDTRVYEVPSGTNPNFAGFVDRVNGYGVLVTGWVPETAVGISDAQQQEMARAYSLIYPRVAALGAPAPLWEPPSGAIRGANDCPDLATTDQLDSLFEGTWSDYKSSGGENDPGAFQAQQLVGAFQCSWADLDSGSLQASASVLPGGASFFAEARQAADAPAWQPTSSLPGEAYITPDGLSAVVLIDDNWIQVTVPTADSLPAFVDVVLSNVGVAR